MKINDVYDGSVIWCDDKILGIKGMTLEERFGDKFNFAEIVPIPNVALNYDLVFQKLSLEQRELIDLYKNVESVYEN